MSPLKKKSEDNRLDYQPLLGNGARVPPFIPVAPGGFFISCLIVRVAMRKRGVFQFRKRLSVEYVKWMICGYRFVFDSFRAFTFEKNVNAFVLVRVHVCVVFQQL